MGDPQGKNAGPMPWSENAPVVPWLRRRWRRVSQLVAILALGAEYDADSDGVVRHEGETAADSRGPVKDPDAFPPEMPEPPDIAP